MGRRRGPAIASALLALLAVAGCGAIAGCGLGPGESLEDVSLTVTRDFGATPLLARQVGDVSEADTVMRVLERNADIETKEGARYVRAIDGAEETRRDGRPYDWFFFVDGVESPVGAADYSLRGGERIWWDYRDWLATNHVPAVVGSWPAPFVAGYEGKEHPVTVACEGGGEACATVRQALAREGVKVAAGSPAGAIRVLVGPWARLRTDPAAAQIENGPAESGVYAEFERAAGGYRLRGLDEAADPAHTFGPGAGLLAATRRYEAPPTWVVTGATGAAVRAAASLLDAADLRDHYAVASEAGKETPLPLPEAER
jgi:uncharacterized protein DUF4430